MSKKMYQPFFWGDYLRDTGQLSLLEHGAYLRLIGEYWNTGKPIPADAERMRRACGAHSDADAAAIEYVLGRYFERDGDVWRHHRIDEDLNAHKTHAHKASEAARTAARARWSQADDDASGMRTACVSDANHSTPLQDIPLTPVVPTPGRKSEAGSTSFDAFWQAYPLKVGKPKALTAWKSQKLDAVAAEVMAGLDRWKACQQWRRDGGKFITHPTTWLNQRRWENDPNPERLAAKVAYQPDANIPF